MLVNCTTVSQATTMSSWKLSQQNVIAGMFGFKQAEFLQVPEEEKAVPKVDFSGLGD